MPLTDLTTVAAASREAGKGLGAFNVVQLETAQVLVDAAAAAVAPSCCRSARTP